MLKWTRTATAILVAAVIISGSTRVSAASDVSAKAYVVMEAVTGRVVDSSNSETKLPIASTTKILTALIALEQPNVTEMFEVDSNAIMVEGSSMGLRKGDKASLEALAYGMLLPSGNDAANAAAVRISGSIPEFAAVMNNRAKQIGMNNSSFVTPSGLHEDSHYSTAYDMALLAREALKNPTFAQVCSKQKAKLEFGNPPYPRYLVNHNKLLSMYEGCIGIKTGFTKKAGRCLVTAAQRDGVTLICVTLNAPNDWQDHQKLFDNGFDKMEKTLIEPNINDISLNAVGGVANKFKVKALDKTYAPITSEQAAKLSQKVNAQQFYYAPVKKGQLVGEIEYILEGTVVATTDLIAAEAVEIDTTVRAKSFFEKVKDFFKGIFK